MKKIFIYLFIYYSIFLFTVESIAIFSLVNVIFVLHMFWVFKTLKIDDHCLILFSFLIISIPLSFKSILGIPYGELPLSWYNIFWGILIAVALLKGMTKGEIFVNKLGILAFVLLIYIFIPMFNSLSIMEGIKQTLNYSIFLSLLMLKPNFKFSFQKYNFLIQMYTTMTAAVAGVVIIQAILFRLGIQLGNVILFGGERYATGYLFGDFSFLSLFLVSPIFLMIFSDNKKYLKVIVIGILLIASFLTTARTGIVSLGVCVALYFVVFTLKNIIKKTPIIIFGWGAGIFLSVMFLGLLKLVREEGLFSGSGRFEGYKIALMEIMNNPILGNGFDLDWYTTKFNTTIPHNIFIQILLQGGIIFLTLILVLLIVLFREILKNNVKNIWSYILMIIGAQFIPDLFDSRFFVVLAVILSISIVAKFNDNSKLPIKGI